MTGKANSKTLSEQSVNGIAALPVGDVQGRGFWSEDVTIDPTTAQRWKAEYLHPHQRPLRRWWAETLAGHLKAGRLQPSTLRLVHIGEQTYLNDGQHRIESVILADQPSDFTVQHIIGQSLDDANRDYSVTDRGLPRTHGDALRIYDIQNRYNLSASAVRQTNAAMNWILTGFNLKSKENRHLQSDSSLRPQLFQNWIDEIKWYYGIISDCHPSPDSLFHRAPLIAVALITLRYQLDQANQFWSRVMLDDRLARNSPEKALWRFLLNNPASLAANEGHHHYYALAWNKYFTGETINHLRQFAPYNKPITILGTPYDGKKVIIPNIAEE